jgi:integrase/recombinase XerD
MTALAPTLEAFFTDRLMAQKGASPKTIATYRDAFRLLLGFVHAQTGKQPFELDFADLDAALIAKFLNHLEQVRGNSPRTRNNRLAAIHSFYMYSAFRHPEHAATIARVLEIPMKRYERNGITYLDQKRSRRCSPSPTGPPGSDDATTRCYSPRSRPVCASPNSPSSESATSASAPAPTAESRAKAASKGSRRSSPRRSRCSANGCTSAEAMTTSRCSRPGKDASSAATPSPSCCANTSRPRPATAHRSPPNASVPHALRHTNAMLLRAQRTDIATIALWLGHESIKTTYTYQHADNKLKQEAIDRTAPIGTPPGRYQPPDQLLDFLESL